MESKPATPREEYGRRLDALLAEESRSTRRSNLLASLKLTSVLIIVILAVILAKYDPASLVFLVIPVAAIVVLFVLHERTLRLLCRCARLKTIYERGIARLEDRWAGTGPEGERFLDPAHPYARDLDLFGKGSLFQLLCTARTRAGEGTLASWLLSAASVAEIQARQQAIEELRPLLDFREKLALAGEDILVGVRPESLIAWSETRTRLNPKLTRIAAPILVVLWLLSLIGWALLGWGAVALVMTLVNFLVTYRTRTQVDRAAEAIEEATHDLDLLAAMFRRIETQRFTTKKLVDLQAALLSGKEPASSAIFRLYRRNVWLESHENLFVKFADLFVFWTAQCASAVEAWRVPYGDAVRGWMKVMGEIEALNSLANYAYEQPCDAFPQFVERGPHLHAEALSHPLIPRARAVSNDLTLDNTLQLVVISGPNMAGKSTFIRSVGINAVLAQAGAPVRARKMVLSPLAVTASICVLDSLQGGLSRFYAEIMRLKLIDERSKGPIPVLFLLDELLSGTNSHDRRVGTESFVHSLLARGAIGLVTTHDLALAKIAEDIPGQAANFHFEDRFENGELRFNYRLKPGVVSTTNALKLMRAAGLDVNLL